MLITGVARLSAPVEGIADLAGIGYTWQGELFRKSGNRRSVRRRDGVFVRAVNPPSEDAEKRGNHKNYEQPQVRAKLHSESEILLCVVRTAKLFQAKRARHTMHFFFFLADRVQREKKGHHYK